MVEAIAASNRVLANAAHAVNDTELHGFNFPIDSIEKFDELEKAILANADAKNSLVSQNNILINLYLFEM